MVGRVDASIPREPEGWLRWGGAPVEHQAFLVTGDKARARESRKCVRDRGALSAHEPADQPVGQRQRQEHSMRPDLSPALGEMPEKQSDPYVGSGVRGRSALDI